MILIKDFTKNHKFDQIYEGPFKETNVDGSYIEYLKNNKNIKFIKILLKTVIKLNERNIFFKRWNRFKFSTK